MGVGVGVQLVLIHSWREKPDACTCMRVLIHICIPVAAAECFPH